MFIYLLYSHESYFQSEGLKCMDVDGNSILHLAAKCSPEKSLHFAKIILNFNSGAYRKMMNMRNNEGCTPLFVAVQNRNGDMVKFMMDSNAMYMPDITIKNKSGETVREYIERNLQHSFHPLELNMKQIFSKYHKYENRILLKAIVGVTN